MKKTAKQLDFEFTKKVLDTPTRLLRGSVRGSDPIESQGAAIRALEHQTWLQKELLHIIATEGAADGEGNRISGELPCAGAVHGSEEAE